MARRVGSESAANVASRICITKMLYKQGIICKRNLDFDAVRAIVTLDVVGCERVSRRTGLQHGCLRRRPGAVLCRRGSAVSRQVRPLNGLFRPVDGQALVPAGDRGSQALLLALSICGRHSAAVSPIALKVRIATGVYSGNVTPEPPISLGTSFIFGLPS